MTMTMMQFTVQFLLSPRMVEFFEFCFVQKHIRVKGEFVSESSPVGGIFTNESEKVALAEV